METWLIFCIINIIQLLNFVIDVINLGDLVAVVVWLWAIVGGPAELGRLHEGGHGNRVGGVGVALPSSVQNSLTELLVTLHDEVPAV